MFVKRSNLVIVVSLLDFAYLTFVNASLTMGFGLMTKRWILISGKRFFMDCQSIKCMVFNLFCTWLHKYNTDRRTKKLFEDSPVIPSQHMDRNICIRNHFICLNISLFSIIKHEWFPIQLMFTHVPRPHSCSYST